MEQSTDWLALSCPDTALRVTQQPCVSHGRILHISEGTKAHFKAYKGSLVSGRIQLIEVPLCIEATNKTIASCLTEY